MADFGDPSTWEMNVDQFIDSGLPKEKPQELLDLQEQNRKQRLLQSLQKIGGRLEDTSLDFIRRENFAVKGFTDEQLLDLGFSKGSNLQPQKETYKKLAEIFQQADIDDELEYLFQPSKNNPKGKITNTRNVFNKLPEDEKGLKYIANLLGEDVEFVLDMIDDKKILEEMSRTERMQKKKTLKSERLNKDFGKVENWMLNNASKYSDPDKFKKATVNRFGKKNAAIKAMTSGGGNFFSTEFNNDILGYKGTADFAKINKSIGDNIFRTTIYNFNPNVRKAVTNEFKSILSGGPAEVKQEARKKIGESKLLKQYNLDKKIHGPISRLIYKEIGEDLYKNMQSFRNPRVGTINLIRFLENEVDPKYKGQFKQARIAMEAAGKNEFKKAKEILGISDKIMYDHKIPSSFIDAGYADEIEYIKTTPTTENFNVKIKNKQYDVPVKKLLNKFEKAKTPEAKEVIYDLILEKHNNFSEKYGGYLDNVKPSFTDGKIKFSSDASPVSKKTDFVKDFTKAGVQTGELDQKQVKKLIAAISPKKKCQGFFSAGGPVNIDKCFYEGLKAVNEVKIKPGAQARNFAKFANRAYKLGRGIMKFGVIPEALFVGAESLIRMNLGDTLDESLYRAADLFIPGNQTDYADVLKIERTVGPEAAEVFRNVTKWKRKNEELQSLEQAEQADLALAGTDFAETNSGVSADETRKTYAGLKDKKRKEVLDASVSKDDQVLSQSYFNEAYDISKAKSTSAKIKGKVLEDESGLNVDLLAPEKNQQFQKIKNFREDMEFSEDDILKEINSNIQKGFYKNVEEAKLHYFRTLFAKEKFKEKPLSSFVLDDGYTPEQVYGTQGGEGFLNKINREKFIRPGTYEATPEEIDANFDMQGGIMAASGGRIGFKDGPKNPGRRTFIKAAAGLASIPILGKFFKGAKVASLIKPIPNSSTVMPDWFPNFVDKFVGRSIGKKIDADLMEYTNPDLPNIKLTRKDDGSILVEGTNEHNQAYNISYEPPGYELIDEKTGKSIKTKGEFEAVEGRHVALGPEDYDTDAFYADDLDELFTSDIAEMEKYTTGNVTKTVKDAFGTETGLKKGKYDIDMAQGQAENRADILRDEGLDEID